ncbi:type IV toxin-antitoxin system AbiEi family antitoxin domain-containing protein [Actinomarinicola tropica]|uniref:AbiEi antitoxin N-terminal domain-containing protein n=1 Tax=Actinomarinicola tropica TaxID=2789776 RepID=A0A5Q2RDG4_9ACTN|nr:type IV toxin-antitoxin system AbiEi family antitoxin domain-containing protein [Actinomarinicola tropica]QGG93744.1 hypothetical protein GH723_00685 [Actinomarinicola tropica]
MSTVDGALAALARTQHGLVTRDQAFELGATSGMLSRRARSGRIERVLPGVLRIGGAPVTFAQRLLGAVLWAGEGALASHRAAARVHGALSRGSVPIEITVPYERNPRHRGIRVHRSLDLCRADPVVVDGIPVTGLARSILDLGAVAPAQVTRAVNAARRAEAIEWDDLLRVLVTHERQGRRGVAALRSVLAPHYRDLLTDSSTEDRAYAILERSAVVPLPVSQHPVVCADGVEVTVDFAWPEHRALLEVYGVDHLTNEPLQHLDLHRRNQIELAGYRLLVYTGRLLDRQPDQFVRDVRGMLAQAGCPLPLL